MRHSCGTILAAQGVPLAEVMAILGHAQINTTMRYVHSLPETQRRAAAKMNDVLWGEG
jgi:integrase